MPEKIGFDLTLISDLNKVSGEEIIALYLVKEICESELKNQFVFFSDKKVEKQLRRSYKNLRIVVTRKKGKKFYKNFLKKYTKKNPLKLMFYPHVSDKMTYHSTFLSVAVLHGLNGKDVKRKQMRKITKFLKECHGVIAVSDFVKQEFLKKAKKYNSEHVYVIENPLSDIRAGVEIVYKKKFILCVSNDYKNKNLLNVVKAYNEIAGIIEHDLVIVGDIDEKGKTSKYINKYGLSHKVIVTGHVERDTLFGYYKGADLFVNASIYEGFGLTPLEAMAMGTKVVTTITPSIASLKTLECDGYIMNPKNYKDIGETILLAVNTPKNEEQLKNKAQAVRELFDPKSVFDKYIALLKKI
ncbi:MAG: glycosyltransferase [Clostridiales bacterium]|nr:glycosyltransferase [Clostridiales bacterium]